METTAHRTPLAPTTEATDLEYAFFHIRTPDEIGHASGWGSPAYAHAATDADVVLGSIVDFVQADPVPATTTAKDLRVD